MGSLARCDRCGSAITVTVTRNEERLAVCGCTKILGATIHDTPDHWAPVLSEEQERGQGRDQGPAVQ